MKQRFENYKSHPSHYGYRGNTRNRSGWKDCQNNRSVKPNSGTPWWKRSYNGRVHRRNMFSSPGQSKPWVSLSSRFGQSNRDLDDKLKDSSEPPDLRLRLKLTRNYANSAKKPADLSKEVSENFDLSWSKRCIRNSKGNGVSVTYSEDEDDLRESRTISISTKPKSSDSSWLARNYRKRKSLELEANFAADDKHEDDPGRINGNHIMKVPRINSPLRPQSHYHDNNNNRESIAKKFIRETADSDEERYSSQQLKSAYSRYDDDDYYERYSPRKHKSHGGSGNSKITKKYKSAFDRQTDLLMQSILSDKGKHDFSRNYDNREVNGKDKITESNTLLSACQNEVQRHRQTQSDYYSEKKRHSDDSDSSSKRMRHKSGSSSYSSVSSNSHRNDLSNNNESKRKKRKKGKKKKNTDDFGKLMSKLNSYHKDYETSVRSDKADEGKEHDRSSRCNGEKPEYSNRDNLSNKGLPRQYETNDRQRDTLSKSKTLPVIYSQNRKPAAYWFSDPSSVSSSSCSSPSSVSWNSDSNASSKSSSTTDSTDSSSSSSSLELVKSQLKKAFVVSVKKEPKTKFCSSDFFPSSSSTVGSRKNDLLPVKKEEVKKSFSPEKQAKPQNESSLAREVCGYNYTVTAEDQEDETTASAVGRTTPLTETELNKSPPPIGFSLLPVSGVLQDTEAVTDKSTSIVPVPSPNQRFGETQNELAHNPVIATNRNDTAVEESDDDENHSRNIDVSTDIPYPLKRIQSLSNSKNSTDLEAQAIFETEVPSYMKKTAAALSLCEYSSSDEDSESSLKTPVQTKTDQRQTPTNMKKDSTLSPVRSVLAASSQEEDNSDIVNKAAQNSVSTDTLAHDTVSSGTVECPNYFFSTADVSSSQRNNISSSYAVCNESEAVAKSLNSANSPRKDVSKSSCVNSASSLTSATCNCVNLASCQGNNISTSNSTTSPIDNGICENVFSSTTNNVSVSSTPRHVGVSVSTGDDVVPNHEESGSTAEVSGNTAAAAAERPRNSKDQISKAIDTRNEDIAISNNPNSPTASFILLDNHTKPSESVNVSDVSSSSATDKAVDLLVATVTSTLSDIRNGTNDKKTPDIFTSTPEGVHSAVGSSPSSQITTTVANSPDIDISTAAAPCILNHIFPTSRPQEVSVSMGACHQSNNSSLKMNNQNDKTVAKPMVAADNCTNTNDNSTVKNSHENQKHSSKFLQGHQEVTDRFLDSPSRFVGEKFSGPVLHNIKTKQAVLEQDFEKDCEVMVSVTKFLLSKDPELHDRLESCLHQCLTDLSDQFLASFQKYVQDARHGLMTSSKQ